MQYSVLSKRHTIQWDTFKSLKKLFSFYDMTGDIHPTKRFFANSFIIIKRLNFMKFQKKS